MRNRLMGGGPRGGSAVTRLIPMLFAAALVVSPPARADAGDTALIRQARATLDAVASRDGPGVVALIARGDKVMFREERGRANIELGVPVAAGDTFRIASVTKMFTAALVLKLSEQGKLSLDDRLAQYLPDFPGAQGMTLRQLLSHTSGVSDIVHDLQPGFSRRDVDTATLVGEIAKRPPDFAPGAGWAYSNSGYILLGAVIEKVTGQPWHAVIAAQLLQPLGLTHIRYGDASALLAQPIAGMIDEHVPHHAGDDGQEVSPITPASPGTG